MRRGNIIYQVSTELDLKLSFGGSLVKCAGFKCKKQQKAIQQNKQWISSRLNFFKLLFYSILFISPRTWNVNDSLMANDESNVLV